MTNLIVEYSDVIPWYTDLHPFLSRIEATVLKYDWLWTDVEVNAQLPIAHRDDGRYWIRGETLLQFTKNRPQFSWSVLSAIPSELKEIANRENCEPFADGNPKFWEGIPVPQHPCSDFEIVCWDSTSTLLIGADDALACAFEQAYPGTFDLDEANKNRKTS